MKLKFMLIVSTALVMPKTFGYHGNDSAYNVNDPRQAVKPLAPEMTHRRGYSNGSNQAAAGKKAEPQGLTRPGNGSMHKDADGSRGGHKSLPLPDEII